ncbi:MAG: phosphatase, partial [Selenomonas noxia]
ALPQMIAMFGSGRPLTEADTAVLLRAAPDRLHNIVPGMIIASVLAETFAAADIRYSDSGVREGYIWKEIIGAEQR